MEFIMKNKGAPVFRGAMGGFNKKDVNEYIAGLARDFEKREVEKEEEISALEAKIAELDGKLSEANETGKVAEDLEKSLSEAEAVIAAQNEKLSAYADEVKSLKTSIEDLEFKLLEYSEMEEKFKQYESMTTRMGEIFMEASADADRIRREAKASSEELARAAAEECRKRQASVYKKLDEFAVARKAEINQLLEKAQVNINATLKDFESKARGLTSDTSPSDLDPFGSGR